MADISFLLLIFFLVATTMHTDYGLNRLLPPWQDEPDPGAEVLRRNIMQVFVRGDDVIMMDEEIVELDQIRAKAKIFILNIARDEEKPEIEMTEIEGLPEQHPVSKGIISLRNDRGTSYGRYIAVQNELTRAFSELRDDAARKYFHKGYGELSEDQLKAINQAVPLKISEAEPHTAGGQ